MLNHEISRPNLLDRLKKHYGSDPKTCAALGVPDNYTTRWRKQGYVPEQWALDIERLKVRDHHGLIDAYTVLEEAERARQAAIAAIEQEAQRTA